MTMRFKAFVTALLTAGLFSSPAHAAPGVGDLAPDWTLPGSDGQSYTLSELRGQWVVVAFFPKAFTGGWTIECKALRDSDREIRNFNVAYFMASVDKAEDNRAFAEKNGATFPILSDEDKSVSADYGVLHAMGFAKRWTFYIDGEGTIARIDKDVNPRTAGADLVASLQAMNVPTTADEQLPLIPEEPNSE